MYCICTFHISLISLYSTLLPERWAATGGPRWRASRESHPSEDLSELPPLLDPDFTQGCGWAGVSLSAGGVIALQAAKLKGRKWNPYTRCLRWPSFDGAMLHRQVLAHFRYRCPLTGDPLANVSLLPVIPFSRIMRKLKIPLTFHAEKTSR